MRFIVKGKKPLKGEITASGSKNAALPILAATLLSSDEFTISNVPDIQDIRTMLEIMKHIGSEYGFSDNVLHIQTKEIKNTEIPLDMVKTMRASILLIGPMLARAKQITIGYPGGCVLGKRPIDTHLDAFMELGVSVREEENVLYLESSGLTSDNVVLKEISVTATENILMLAAGSDKEIEIRLAAQEPHVQDLCKFLVSIGAFIRGEGTHVVNITGNTNLKGCEHRIRSDYLEIGTLAIAAAGTCGDIIINDVHEHDLDALWQKLHEAGVILDFTDTKLRVRGVKKMESISKLDTGIFPKFPTDLQAPFMVLMTQAHGVSKVFETLFDGRLNYLFELEKMGARFEFLNPHQAIILGPTPLRGAPIASCDIRAGAAMIVAALIAEGSTEISSINYIDRGYERFNEKLASLGANIIRCQTEEDMQQGQRGIDRSQMSVTGELEPSVSIKF